MAEHNQCFDSFIQWVNKASSWLTRHNDYHEKWFRAVCFDSKGRICRSGKEFNRARDENTFPVYWVWPDQNIFDVVDHARGDDEPIAYMRDLDGTGSLHVCAKGDPGAIAVYARGES